MGRQSRWGTAGAAVALVAAATAAAVGPARADTGCRASLRVASQWPGGFTAEVAVTNLGDPVTAWRVAWTFPGGQVVTQAWNGTAGQSGPRVTVADAGWNGALGSGATVSFGFVATGDAAGAVPTDLRLNDTACTGSTLPTAPPTTAPPTTAVPSATAVPTTATPAPTTPTTTPTRPPTPTAAPSTPPAAYPGPGRATGAVGVHDPAVVRAPDGTYLRFGTGDGIPIATSTDRIAWRAAGSVFPGGTPWADTWTGGSRSLWAPDISHHDGRFRLYYSASTFGSDRSAIFMATSPTGRSGSWTDAGLVVSSGGTGWNAIDPNLVVDAQGRHWLAFGSFWNGIQLVRIDPASGRRADGAVTTLARRPSAGGAVEAPFVVRRDGWYYLYVSFDACCRGAASTYRIMVGRSRDVTGPYLDRAGTPMTAGGGTQVLAGHGGVHGPGHPAVLADVDGDQLVYHWYADDGSPRLGINHLGRDPDGWPYVW